MSRFGAETLCFALRDGKCREHFRTDPDGFLANYSLVDSEKEAIKRGDVGRLFQMGVLPQVLFYLAAAFEYEDVTYVRRLREAAGLPEIKHQMDLLTQRSRKIKVG